MKQKDWRALKSELENADEYALSREDESSITGDDNEEWSLGTAGRGQSTPSIEKNLYPQSATPEEIYQAEREISQPKSVSDVFANAARKMDEQESTRYMEELERLREEQGNPCPYREENPVNQSPAARLPAHALPPRSPPSVTPTQGMPPQIPGAQSQPGPQNPFAQPAPPAKPESGLPWKPPGGKTVKHDCLTVHPMKKHEEWEEEKQEAKKTISAKNWVTLSDGRHIDIGGKGDSAGDHNKKMKENGFKRTQHNLITHPAVADQNLTHSTWEDSKSGDQVHVIQDWGDPENPEVRTVTHHPSGT